LLVELRQDTVMNGIGALSQVGLKEDRQDAYDLTILLLDTGARYSEIAEIKWKDIDLRKKTMSIYRKKVDNESVLGMTSRAHQILTRRFHEKRVGQQFVFTAEDGGARKYAPKSFNKACRRAEIDGVTCTPYGTNASRLVQNGLSLQEEGAFGSLVDSDDDDLCVPCCERCLVKGGVGS
jgi:integrase